MLKIVKGNLLEAKENLIMHQCNEQAIFGGGLAYQIKGKYQQVEIECLKYIKEMDERGIEEIQKHFVISKISETQSIVNCFTQKDFVTQYNAIREVFTYIKHYAKENGLSIACPFKYGAGISKGDFTEILEILIEIFDDYDITIYKF